MGKKEVAERLVQWVDTQYAERWLASKSLDTHPSALHKYLKGMNMPGGEFLTRIALAGCNVNWLLHGIGDMYSNDEFGVAAKAAAEKPVSPLGGESTGYAATLDPKKRKG